MYLVGNRLGVRIRNLQGGFLRSEGTVASNVAPSFHPLDVNSFRFSQTIEDHEFSLSRFVTSRRSVSGNTSQSVHKEYS